MAGLGFELKAVWFWSLHYSPLCNPSPWQLQGDTSTWNQGTLLYHFRSGCFSLPHQPFKLLEGFIVSLKQAATLCDHPMHWGPSHCPLYQGLSVQSQHQGNSIVAFGEESSRTGRTEGKVGFLTPISFPCFSCCPPSQKVFCQVFPGLLGPTELSISLGLQSASCRQGGGQEVRWKLSHTCVVLWTLDLELICSSAERKHVLNQGLHVQREVLDRGFFFFLSPDFTIFTSVTAEFCRPE